MKMVDRRRFSITVAKLSAKYFWGISGPNKGEELEEEGIYFRGTKTGIIWKIFLFRSSNKIHF